MNENKWLITILNLGGIFVRSWLIFIQHVPYFVKFCSMLGVGVGIRTKIIFYWFIEGQSHFGMSRGAKISLALNELI